MRANWMGALVGAGALLAVPAAAIAGGTMVDHGHGATVAHDPAYAGVKTQVHAWSKDGETRFRLMATGLPPNSSFGAHVHTGRCGLDPLASGGHYQHPGEHRSAVGAGGLARHHHGRPGPGGLRDHAPVDDRAGRGGVRRHPRRTDQPDDRCRRRPVAVHGRGVRRVSQPSSFWNHSTSIQRPNFWPTSRKVPTTS